ncbi:MAG: hypothetical protein ACKOZW_10180 [Cyanobium sp.]
MSMGDKRRVGRHRWGGQGGTLVAALAATVLASCSGTGETPQSRAKVGDTLVRAGGVEVRLEHSFRPAEPNALLDGAVRVRSTEGQQLLELNAVCSMPQAPGWPTYDNLYGRAIQRGEEAKGTTGTTSWQVLFHFDGRQEARMGTSPGPWLARLRDNLCRRGAFDDRPGKR